MRLILKNKPSHSCDFDNSLATPNSLPDFNSRELEKEWIKMPNLEPAKILPAVFLCAFADS